MHHIFAVAILFVFSMALHAENPWVRTYSTDQDDRLYSLVRTSDGGCLAVGRADLTQTQGSDALCIKTDATGHMLWQKSYGGKGDDKFEEIVQLKDGAFLVGGSTESSGPGKSNVWLAKMNSSGSLTWQRQYGIKTTEGGYVEFRLWGVILTRENDFFIYGERTLTFDTGLWYTDAWCGRLRQDGSILWSYLLSPGAFNTCRDAQQTSDGGFILEGDTGTVIGSDTVWNAFCVKIDPKGVVEWASEYDWNDDDYGSGGIRETPDGGYVLAGHTWVDSYNSDVWLIKAGSQGAIEWQKGYGRNSNDGAYSLQLTGDGGYVMACMSDVPNVGREDIVYLKTDATGKPILQQAYALKAEGTYYEGYYPWHLVQTSDAGYYIVGFAHQNYIGDGIIIRRTSPSSICPAVTSKAKLSNKSVRFTARSITIERGWNPITLTKAKLKAYAAKLTETNPCSTRVRSK